ncbi:MAG TPA: hypothetical protein VG269_26450 [Tepidisphaeraceae bacterium]|nr:hypothetical protein [Tepidisphaeraceae bacterium]
MTIEHFRDWPRPARVRYSSGQNMGPTGDYSKLRGPIQALNHFGGAHTKPWRWRQFEGSYGAICISALPDGSVDWDLPAMEKFRSITTVTWSNPMPYWQVVLPHWVIFALLAVLPSFRLALIAGGWMIRKFRRKEGCCAACGYDLRATPDRCPECGAVPAAANAKA